MFACPLCPQELIQYNCVSHTHEVWTWLCACSFCLQSRYSQAKLSIHDRTLKVAAVVESLEREMELLCLTGVEDQLQADVRPTLEMLRNAGIKVQPASSGCQNCFLTESNSLFPWNTVLGCSMGWQLTPHFLSRLALEVFTVPSSRLLSGSFFFSHPRQRSLPETGLRTYPSPWHMRIVWGGLPASHLPCWLFSHLYVIKILHHQSGTETTCGPGSVQASIAHGTQH